MEGERCEIRVDKQHWDDQARDMRSRLQTWDWRWKPARKLGQTRIDFSGVEFMEPWALVMFTCFALQLKQEGLQVEVVLNPENPSNRYLQLMGLPHVLETMSSTPHWDQSSYNTGLHVLRSHQDVTRFVRSAAAFTEGPRQETVDALQYGMAELGRNVVQHAQSAIGGVAIAQHFPEGKAVQIAICDTGRGIFDSLRTNYPELRSHLESLKLAVLPHSSGAAPPGPYGSTENAGLGLFFCKEICWRTGGGFWLASCDALLGINDNDSSGRGRIYRRINSWPGTLVVMHLPDQEAVAFDELLALCRRLSLDARQHAGSAALDFVDEQSDISADSMITVHVDAILEDVEAAVRVRDTQIRPGINRGQLVVLDFGGARFATQSFVHALLHDVFRVPGSLTKLIFRHCTKGTEEAIRLVAAYSATYRQQEF